MGWRLQRAYFYAQTLNSRYRGGGKGKLVTLAVSLVQEGTNPLQCYCIYKHNKPNRHRMVWVKWDWDNIYKEVFGSQILDQESVGKGSWKPTDFYMRSRK